MANYADDARLAAELQKNEMQSSSSPQVVYAQSAPMHGTVSTVPLAGVTVVGGPAAGTIFTGIDSTPPEISRITVSSFSISQGNVALVTSSAPQDEALVLTDVELVMFSYKSSVQCLALIDIIFTLCELSIFLKISLMMPSKKKCVGVIQSLIHCHCLTHFDPPS